MGGLIWGSMEAGKASRSAMGSAATVIAVATVQGDPCDT
jgi:hypothetical protein